MIVRIQDAVWANCDFFANGNVGRTIDDAVVPNVCAISDFYLAGNTSLSGENSTVRCDLNFIADAPVIRNVHAGPEFHLEILPNRKLIIISKSQYGPLAQSEVCSNVEPPISSN
jgi:hypothetical protein